jgi:hypothetical protein
VFCCRSSGVSLGLLFCWIPPYLFTSTRAKCILLVKEAGCPDLSNRRTNKKLPKSSHKIKREKWEQQKMGGGIDAGSGWLNDFIVTIGSVGDTSTRIIQSREQRPTLASLNLRSMLNHHLLFRQALHISFSLSDWFLFIAVTSIESFLARVISICLLGSTLGSTKVKFPLHSAIKYQNFISNIFKLMHEFTELKFQNHFLEANRIARDLITWIYFQRNSLFLIPAYTNTCYYFEFEQIFSDFFLSFYDMTRLFSL